MSAIRMLILAALLTTTGARAGRGLWPVLPPPHPAAAEAPPPTAVPNASVHSAPAATGSAAELDAWQRRNAGQMARVERAWAALVDRLGGFRPAEFWRQCRALDTSLASLDAAILLPAPDPLVDLHVRRLAGHLHAAVAACRAEQLFDVVYRLEEARSALAEVRWLLELRGATVAGETE